LILRAHLQGLGDVPLGLLDGIKLHTQSIICFVILCKFKACFMILQKKEGMGALE
jgi:hypothetical protein